MASTVRKQMDQRGVRKFLLTGINLIVIFSIACSGLVSPQEVKAATGGEAYQPSASVPLLSPLPAAELRAVDVLPRPGSSDVDPESAVVVTFDQPVVPLTDDGSGLPAAFSIQPAAEGYARWLNTSTYIFYPDPPLTGGIEYQVTLNAGLTSTVGAGLARGEDEITGWSFSTAAPRLASIFPDPEEGAINLDQEFELVFNQRMDPDSVQGNLRLQAGTGSNIPGTFTWEDDHTVLTFAPSQLLKRSTDYRLILSGQAASAGGTRLGQSTVQAFTTVPVLDVAGTYPEEGELISYYGGYGSFRVEMTAPLDPFQEYQEMVQISPAITDANYLIDGNSIYVSGFLDPDQTYKVTLSADIKDRWGQPLAGERQLIFRTEPSPARLSIPMLYGGTRILTLLPDQTGLTAQANNISVVDISSGQMSLETFFLPNSMSDDEWEDNLSGFETWQVNLDLFEDQNTVVELPLTVDQKPLSPGIYYFDIQASEIESNYLAPRPFLAVVSPLNISLKRNRDEVFLWAVDLLTEAPVVGKEFVFYDKWMNPFAKAVTGADGSCRITLPDYIDDETSVYAVIGQPGDVDFGLVSDSWLSETNGRYYGWHNRWWEDTRQIYLYTDRPIYRPGDTVHFRAMIRDEEGGGYAAPPSGQVEATIYHDGQSREEIGTVNLSLSSYGTASGEITLPEDATPGTYTLFVWNVDGRKSLYFKVANYRKPEIDLQVNFDKDDWQVGEELTASVQTDYYFGAPAGDVGLWWILYSKGGDFRLPFEYVTGSRSTSWLASEDDLYYYDPELGEEIAWGEAKTSFDGSLDLVIGSEEVLKEIDAENLQNLTLQVIVVDEQEMRVAARDSASLHPAPFYIGVRSETWVGRAGVESGFRIQTTDWQKKPSGDHVLQAQFQKITWEQADPVDWVPHSNRRQPVFTTISSADLVTDGQGRARLAFTPPEPGMYVLKVFGEGAVTERILWVGGSQAAQWPNLSDQKLQLTSDKSAYRPGDVARILIPNPFGGKALALVTVEREKVLSAEVIEMEGGMYQWELPLTDNHAPNVFVAVTLLGKEGDGVSTFRQGYVELEVQPVAQTLTVELVTTPTQSEPGGEVSFDIQVRDSYGQPAQGEFSIAVVDKAVLALADSEAPDILTAFYSPRPLQVNNSLSLSNSANRIPLIPLDGRGGGGGGPESVQLVLREDFEDTALWQGSVETDSFGIAKVTMTLPDNLTTWVADLRGITRDTKVGSAGSEIVVSKPLLVRPQTPRFFVAGDHTALRAVVHNNTPQELTVDVSLQAVGVALDDGTVSMQFITLASGGRETVTWWGTVQETEEVGLVFQAVSGGLQDAARPEQGMLPVLRYQVPASFVTAGVLADAGEQVETIQMPTTFTPVGGDLQVELSPSLAANVIREMEALKAFPYDFTEPLVSHLLPNLELYRATQELDLTIPGLESDLEEEIDKSLDRLLRYQNEDGGWGWTSGRESDAYITAYALFALGRARQVGVYVSPEKLLNAEDYLRKVLVSPEEFSNIWQLDRLVFQYFALTQYTDNQLDLQSLFEKREILNPWSQALLALMINRENVADQRAYDLLSNLESTAKRSASGVHWEDRDDSSRYNFSSAHFNTAVVVYAIAQMDPASPLLRDGMRYLVTQRANGGGWASSYETAWVLMGLIESMKATSDFNPRYSYAADLNGKTLLSGGVDSGNRLTPVSSFVLLTDLQQKTLNELRISREDGSGNLYYRALLNLERPAEEAEAEQNGLSITRSYHGIGAACTTESCPMIESLTLGSESGVAEVRLTLTLPEEMSYLVVEDFIPAGAEIIDPQLKTSQAQEIQYDPRNPFGNGWGWWYFNDAQVYDDHVRWIGQRVPAGTYVLTYHLQAVQAGEYRTLPARAYEYYFPDVRGNTAGGVFEIE